MTENTDVVAYDHHDDEEYKVMRAKAVDVCNRLAGGDRRGGLAYFARFEAALQAATLFAAPNAELAHEAYLVAVQVFTDHKL